MARAGRGGGDEVEGLDEEFLFHLNRGSDLLSRGDAEAARASLERALELRPKDAKVLGLLGQSYYRLGRFDDAAGAYGRLVDENPIEAAGRVNLGLACLKARRYPEAVKQLSIALDMNPDHKRAMGYLGLALLESGEPRKAREWFVRSGSEAMVVRCDEALASPRAPAAAALGPDDGPEPIHALPPEGVAAVGAGSGGAVGLAAWAGSRLVPPAAAEPFASDGHTLTVTVRGEVLGRLDGLYAARGNVRMAPEMKRFRGRATDQAFGEGARRMHRMGGDGVLLYRAGDRCFTALELGPDSGYFREEVVFALEEPVVFENGRVPSQVGVDLHLVHLRGRGRFLLVTSGQPVAVEVSAAAPLRVPIEALVGWVGALTPRVTSLAELAPAPGGGGEAGGLVLVELTGDGRALVDPSWAAAGGREAPAR